jgi:hypothetical protein
MQYGRYCAGESEWAALPAQGTARLHVRQTWFGRHVFFVERETVEAREVR